MQQESTRDIKSGPEIIMKRYKLQYLDASKGERRDFGAPVLSLREEDALKYFEEHRILFEVKGKNSQADRAGAEVSMSNYKQLLCSPKESVLIA